MFYLLMIKLIISVLEVFIQTFGKLLAMGFRAKSIPAQFMVQHADE